ncbi:MAG: helix-turn-helix domain-containing protein [Arcobacter sp.]|nr:helix-turn-helix domain-containing protein [Arcobacter sp.]
MPVFLKTLILDSHDVAKILKVQARTIINWAKENLGPKCKKIGKSYIYTKRDIAEFLATS